MTVTKIEEYNSQKVKVYIDGLFAFVLYKGELSKYGIREGQIISREHYTLLTEDVLVKRARLRAMNLLTKRPYSEAELRRKLSLNDYPEYLIDNALSYVKSFGYINDHTYASDYIASVSGRYPRNVIRQKLIQKGIPADIIESCLSEGEEELQEMEEDLIVSLIEKKARNLDLSDPAQLAKLYRYLAGKGFSTGRIRSAVSKYQAER
ncbi:MAG: recombination regulator RecX [Lachnospiraceae bacterium]|nr:recombination regulator RecX [Lachnospiraceae bacterium]